MTAEEQDRIAEICGWDDDNCHQSAIYCAKCWAEMWESEVASARAEGIREGEDAFQDERPLGTVRFFVSRGFEEDRDQLQAIADDAARDEYAIL